MAPLSQDGNILHIHSLELFLLYTRTVCSNSPDGKRSALSMYDFVLMRRYPWEMYGASNFIPDESSSSSPPVGKDVSLGLVGGTQHGPLSPNLHDKQFIQSDRYKKLVNKKQLM
eukprot:scaffold2086_cov107-Skeletonema_dohrnii-CCMP3373.AAC.7